MRGVITPRSMVAFWLSGFEDRPERSGEICVAEVFGDAVRDGSADVGMGVNACAIPRSSRSSPPSPCRSTSPTSTPTASTGGPASLAFSVDGEVVRRLDQAPDYPAQLMIGVFDFPANADPDEADVPVPELVVSHVRGRSLG